MPYDNICKYLAGQFPREFAAWAVRCATGQVVEVPQAEVLKTELGIEPIRADSVILLRLLTAIVHLEFQLTPQSKPPLPLRMLDYWVRLYRLYHCPIIQVVVILRETGEDIPTEFRAENTWHRYHVVKLWEQDAEAFLSSPALLPLATLARAAEPPRLLERIAAEVENIAAEGVQREVSSCVQLMAGLRFDKQLIRSLFREEIMRESVIYQDIIQEGLREGERVGIQKGIQQGILQGIQQADVAMVLRQLTRRLGTLDETTRTIIATLPIAKLEQLGEDLLDFQETAALDQWLNSHVRS
jgi:predicted transposase/invertase (TIGR01784 family)